ncbi:hypothetical protein C725_0506 [Pacificimonas flava]|uniref:Uncharacterized protein n=1 Tax=Pacificimonas flava TaxID=1234595 RepID=M2TS00_9SPHN|nr:hypothetical protein C725_0506 [Pacificimonas flava]
MDAQRNVRQIWHPAMLSVLTRHFSRFDAQLLPLSARKSHSGGRIAYEGYTTYVTLYSIKRFNCLTSRMLSAARLF